MSKRGAMTYRQVIRLLKSTALSRTIMPEAIAFSIVRKPDVGRSYRFTDETFPVECCTAF